MFRSILAVICALFVFGAATERIALIQTPQTFDRVACQAASQNPLIGCPNGTLLVGPNSQYMTIQSAIASLPNDTTPAIILVLAGNYTEQVNVTRSGPVYLLGQTPNNQDQTSNTVNVIWAAIAGTGDNAFTSTLTVAPNLNAALTGSGPTGFDVPPDTPFGNVDFRAYNLNFINNYAPYSDGPSLALSMGYANAGFYYCGFFSYQDTIYVGKIGNAYFSKCTIAGQTDFLYGFGTAWVNSSNIELRSCGGGAAAWKGTNTTMPNKFGVYVHNSNIHAANSSLNIVHKCALGRPWNAQMRSIFSNNYLDDSINPAGFIEWQASDPRINNYTFQAEFNDYGPGFNLSSRLAAANVTKELTAEQFQPYSHPKLVFQFFPDGGYGNDKWIDYAA